MDDTAGDGAHNSVTAPPRNICSSRLLPNAWPLGVHLGEHACLELLRSSIERLLLYVLTFHKTGGLNRGSPRKTYARTVFADTVSVLGRPALTSS